jgi:AP-3 complex subunit mu
VNGSTSLCSQISRSLLVNRDALPLHEFGDDSFRVAHYRVVAELFWSNVVKAATPSDVLPIIDAGRHFFIHIQRDGLFFLAVVQKETSPFFVIDFLQRVYELFVDYFDKLSPKVLKANFTVVYQARASLHLLLLAAHFDAMCMQLLDEMMDYGVPFTTEPNTLRDIVAAPDMLSAVAGHGRHACWHAHLTQRARAVLGQSGVAAALPQAAAGDVDWRRRNVKYRTNELFVDLIESVHCIVEPCVHERVFDVS